MEVDGQEAPFQGVRYCDMSPLFLLELTASYRFAVGLKKRGSQSGPSRPRDHEVLVETENLSIVATSQIHVIKPF